jgi:hypothetical protein
MRNNFSEYKEDDAGRKLQQRFARRDLFKASSRWKTDVLF